MNADEEGGGPPPRFTAGDLLAERFRILRYIDRGGTGEVYEAEDRIEGRRLALKVLRPEMADDVYALELFRREVELASAIEHPGICRVYELLHHRDVPFLSMELLGGETLAARLARGTMSPAEALPLVRQMAAALEAAHAAGLVHGDFKTGNVMLVPDGGGVRAVVTDFGTAPVRAADAPWVTPETVAGTPAYMAPEQARGCAPEPPADIYALGVVLYEMVTGALPHEGETALELLTRRVNELAPTPRSRAKGLDARWELVILRCLEPDPRDRFEGVDEVVRALDGGRIPPSPAEEERRRIRRWLLAAGLGAAVTGVVASFWLMR
ncbi:MAG TPA: serine/threonine-protein kinase [Thermoanaerobaculia bacterium]|nr:serine/threonine-protein kinase [Thermoanaerobaculia bacterium]